MKYTRYISNYLADNLGLTLIQATENSLLRKTPTKLSLGLSSPRELTKYLSMRSNLDSSFLLLGELVNLLIKY